MQRSARNKEKNYLFLWWRSHRTRCSRIRSMLCYLPHPTNPWQLNWNNMWTELRIVKYMLEYLHSQRSSSWRHWYRTSRIWSFPKSTCPSLSVWISSPWSLSVCCWRGWTLIYCHSTMSASFSSWADHGLWHRDDQHLRFYLHLHCGHHPSHAISSGLSSISGAKSTVHWAVASSFATSGTLALFLLAFLFLGSIFESQRQNEDLWLSGESIWATNGTKRSENGRNIILLFYMWLLGQRWPDKEVQTYRQT